MDTKVFQSSRGNPPYSILLVSIGLATEAAGTSLEPKIYGRSALNSPKTVSLAQVNEC